MNDYIYMWLIDYFIFYNKFDNDVVVFQFMEIIGAKRTSLHSAVDTWLARKNFPLHEFPNECSIGDNAKKHLYEYLLTNTR